MCKAGGAPEGQPSALPGEEVLGRPSLKRRTLQRCRRPLKLGFRVAKAIRPGNGSNRQRLRYRLRLRQPRKRVRLGPGSKEILAVPRLVEVRRLDGSLAGALRGSIEGLTVGAVKAHIETVSGLGIRAQRLLQGGVLLQPDSAALEGLMIMQTVGDSTVEPVQLTLVVIHEHVFEERVCTVCTACGYCTWGASGRGNGLGSCVHDLAGGRQDSAGQPCGCGYGTAGCRQCGVCQACAGLHTCTGPLVVS